MENGEYMLFYSVVPTTEKGYVVYELSCLCEAWYVGRTTQRVADRIKQHVPTSNRTKTL